MLPVQILLNNLLYDSSQIAIPTDKVDEESVMKPKRWDIGFIRRFMLIFGPVSSIFDVLTFTVLFYGFQASEAAFQTGCFIESLATQVLVVYVIRSRHSLLTSRPSKWLTLTTLSCVAVGAIIPYSSLSEFFGFTPLPLPYLAAIISLVTAYLLLVEVVKRWFLQHFGW